VTTKSYYGALVHYLGEDGWMDDGEKVQYLNDLIGQLVRKIEAMQEEIAGPDVDGKVVSAERVAGKLDELLNVEDPGGQAGRLMAAEDDWYIIFLSDGVTAKYEISPEFKGSAWYEDMDRVPREGAEE
jgi:hypothetical protein